jgi:group I intron endonuclease
MAEIYCIENKINGFRYIGKTRHSCKERWLGHIYACKKGHTRLYNAIKKYGIENFDIFTFEDVYDESDLNNREIYWFDALEPEYNMTKGDDGGQIGQGQLGKHWKIKDTSNMKCTKTVTEATLNGRKKLAGSNNYQFKRWIITPWGKFASCLEASNAAKLIKSQKSDNIVISDPGTIKSYINNLDIPLNQKGRRTPKLWRGKTPREIGFTCHDKN